MVTYSCCFGPEVKQNIMERSTWWSKALHFMEARKQRQREKDQFPVSHSRTPVT
jgi:hypothetical protein